MGKRCFFRKTLGFYKFCFFKIRQNCEEYSEIVENFTLFQKEERQLSFLTKMKWIKLCTFPKDKKPNKKTHNAVYKFENKC